MYKALVKTLTDNITYALFERGKGLDFARNEYPYEEGSDRIWYERTHYPHIRKIFEYIKDKKRPVLDVGCGKGYALYCLHRMGFTDVSGLEYTDSIYTTAVKNMHALNLIDTVNLIHGDAAEFTGYDPYEIVYMFHPFHEGVMRHVVGNIEASLKHRPRPFTVVYFHPMAHMLWDRSPIFSKTAQKQIEYFNGALDVYYYEYDPDKLKHNGVSFSDMLKREIYLELGD